VAALLQRIAPGELRPLLFTTGLAAAGAVAYTFSAYELTPLAFPAAMIAVAFVTVAFVRPAWGVAGALAAVPLETVRLPLASGGLSPAESALALLAAVWAVKLVVQPETVRGPALRDLPVIALLLIIAAGLVQAFEPAVVLRVFVFWTLFYFVYLLAQGFTPAEIRLVVIAFVVGTGILGAVGAVIYLQSGSAGVLAGGAVTTERAVGTFVDPNYFASLINLGVLPGLALAIANFRRDGWLLIPAAAGMLGVLFSLSRGGIAGLVLGLIVLLLWARARWIALVLVTLFAATTVLSTNPIVKSDQFGVVEERLESITGPGLKQSQTNRRPLVWGFAAELANESPFIGVGVNQFKVEAGKRGIYERDGPLENAHSVIFSLAAETGYVGLAAFVCFLVQLGARSLRGLSTKSTTRYALSLGLGAALVAFFVQGLVVVQLRTQIVAGAFFLVAGLITGLADRAAKESEEKAAS
jgi:O-antigen ligase